MAFMLRSEGAVVPIGILAIVLGIACCSSDEGDAAGPGKGGKGGSGNAGAAGKGGKAGTSAGGSSSGGEDVGGTSAGGTTDTGGSDAGGTNAGGMGGTDASGAGGAPDDGGTAGAAGASSTVENYANGSRLRAVLEVAGTAKRFASWHDSDLDIDCRFALDSAGTERCVPIAGAGFTSFADDECTQRVVVFPSNAPTPKYVMDPTYAFVCGEGPRYLPVGATIEPSSVYFQNGPDCLLGSPLESTQIVAELGAPVADSTFVAAIETVREARDSRVSANVRVASDGSREVKSFFDLTREAECNPREHADADYACVLWDRAYIQVYFSDDTCETPAAFHPGYAQEVCGRVPTIVEESRPNFTDLYFEVSDELEGPVYRDNGTCTPYDPPADLHASYYGVGEAVPWSAFAPFTASNEGSGRIRQNTLRGGANVLISRLEFYDTEFETSCNATLAADSELRCLPQTSYSLNLFADDGCAEALVEVPAGFSMPPAGTLMAGSAASGGSAIFALGAKVAEPAEAWQLADLRCEAAVVDSGLDFYATEPIAPGEFATVTRVVE
jgi:hypothetical protein